MHFYIYSNICTNQFKIPISLLWIPSTYFRMIYMLGTTINCDWLIVLLTGAGTFIF